MEETFGPVAPIIKVTASISNANSFLIISFKVSGDEEAVRLMNDSKYGLTASVWTSDEQAFESLVDKIEAGTVFQNRCDYLDPALAWTGVKHSGRGISLSKYGEYPFIVHDPMRHIYSPPVQVSTKLLVRRVCTLRRHLRGHGMKLHKREIVTSLTRAV